MAVTEDHHNPSFRGRHTLHEFTAWRQPRRRGLSALIQGEISGQDLVDTWTVGPPDPQFTDSQRKNLADRVGWLRAWILDGARTREELEGFCVYVTDAPAVPPQGITIAPKSMGHPHILIGSHTCFSTLDLNVDDMEGGRDEWLQSFSMNVRDQEYSQT